MSTITLEPFASEDEDDAGMVTILVNGQDVERFTIGETLELIRALHGAINDAQESAERHIVAHHLLTDPPEVPGWVLPDPDSQEEYRRKYMDDSGYWIVVGPDGETLVAGPFATEQQAEDAAEAEIADGNLPDGAVSVAYVSTP
jgi:hypothetical protein